MKTSSQMGQDKSDIPKQLDYYNISSSSEKTLVGSGSTDENSAAYWLQHEAKAKLQEAYAKLGLDSQKVNGKHLLSYTLEELIIEKKKVKGELKNYD
jgi:hypothetical protein